MSFIKGIMKLFSGEKKEPESEQQPDPVLEPYPKTVNDLEKYFRENDLNKYWGKVKPLIRPKIDLNTQPVNEEKLAIGISKIGGKPDLVNQDMWPRAKNGKSMSFIAQVNCSDISITDPEIKMPLNGMISFFYCADQEIWGFDPKDKSSFKVVFTTNSPLIRVDYPADLQAHSRFNANSIEFDPTVSLPNLEYDCMDGVFSDDDDDDMDTYSDLINETSKNQMFGYANPVQGTMELDCQLVTNNIYVGDAKGYEHPKVKELESGKDDWILLLQVDSEDDKTGMMWGDSGMLYFWIRKPDLESQNFDNCWCILQCY